MTWHIDSNLIAGYTEDCLTPAHAASVETHLMTCADCRRLLAENVDRARLERGWASVAARVDQPRLGFVERLLTRVGVRDHLARLVAVTPSLGLPWLVAVAVLLLLSAATTNESLAVADRNFYFFLVLAPLLPLVGVGAAFGSRTDPAHELMLAAPISAVEMLLVRGVAVLATTTALTGVAAIALPENDWAAAAWLLPALGLTTAALALSRWVSATWAAAGLGAAWLTAATWAFVGDAARVRLVDNFVAFRPAGQVAFVALTLAAAAVVVFQRAQFDLRRTT